ncbi:MAG: undecaprenyl-phosphate glucose phosphotransferase [Candidatus Sumerlaeia bacterium]|nr:undecaprenyl-phosphate glucose phosphotransferase [Candidatus Sumerlaeia bacterium]
MDSSGNYGAGLGGRARRTEFLLLQFLTDLFAVTAGLLAGYWFRFFGDIIPSGGAWDPYLYIRQFPWALGIWIVCLYLTGNYHNHPQVISYNRARRLLTGSALAMVVMVAKNYFFRDEDLARILYPIMMVSVTCALVLARVGLQGLIVRFFVGRGLPRSRILIAGLGPTAFRLAARIRMHPEYAYELAGFAAEDPAKVGRRIGGVPVLGTLDDIREVLRTESIQDVFLAKNDLPRDSFLGLFLEGEMAAVRVHVVPTLSEMVRSRVYYDEIAGVPLYRILETPLGGVNAGLKRAFDIVVSALALVFLSPLLALVALLVRRTSPGPALYRQTRLGLDGRAFTILKFRTMPVGVEKHGPGWGDQLDPRATPFGRFLRRWNLDELPQLWNVLRGEMSLVGPRPERPVYVERFREQIPLYMSRHKVKAGMTGWAQVHGLRGSTSIAQRLRYDLYYIENWSLWLDIKILLMTFFRKPRRSPRSMARPLPTPAAPPSDGGNTACLQPSQPALSATKQPG